MDPKISDMLQDLNRIDPAFKASDKKMKKVIADVLSLKPETHFDESFSMRLRDGLTAKKPSRLSPYISLVKNSYSYVSTLIDTRISPQVRNHKMFTGALGAFIAIILVAPLTYVVTKRTIENTPESYVKNISSGLSLKQQISTKEGNAFGKLAYVTSPSEATPKSAKNVQTMSAMSLTTDAVNQATDTTKYTYKGDVVKLTDTQGKVYKRVKGIDAGKQLASFLKSANFNVVNMGAFSKLSLQTIELTEDTPFGYFLGINFNEGVISISPNATQWSAEASTTATTTPDDAGLITIANAFVKDHDIDVSGYGNPVVESHSPKSKPEILSVTYPLHIDNLEVYNQSGTIYGLELVIDMKLGKVSVVNNLTSQIYESSSYDLETDSAKVIAAAGVTASSSKNKNSKNVLTTPYQVLMRYGSDAANELYIPALVFPVQVKNGDTAKNVVVPLVKDALSKISVKSIPDEPSATTTATTTPTPTIPEHVSQNTPSFVEDIKNTLAQKVGISPELISVTTVAAVDWPNSCLGLPKKDELCADVITPGYTIKLTASATTYEYRTNKDGTLIKEIQS